MEELKALAEYDVYLKEMQSDKLGTVEQIAYFVNYLIDRDLKLAPLKNLQGLVWTEGYANGSLKGHVYPDVPEAFKSWRADNLSIAIYSSGSVKAQKLLFGQSIAGDLLPYIADHFDTVIGHKQQQESYANIVEKLQVKAEHVVFLTDIIKGLSRMMIWN